MPNNLIVSECPSQDPAVQMLWETVYGPSAGRSPVPPGPNSSVASNPAIGTTSSPVQGVVRIWGGGFFDPDAPQNPQAGGTDAALLQGAITAAQAVNGLVWLARIFTINVALTYTGTFAMMGPGTIKQANAANLGSMISSFSAADRTVWMDFTIDGNVSNQTGGGTAMDIETPLDFLIYGVTFKDLKNHGVFAGGVPGVLTGGRVDSCTAINVKGVAFGTATNGHNMRFHKCTVKAQPAGASQAYALQGTDGMITECVAGPGLKSQAIQALAGADRAIIAFNRIITYDDAIQILANHCQVIGNLVTLDTTNSGGGVGIVTLGNASYAIIAINEVIGMAQSGLLTDLVQAGTQRGHLFVGNLAKGNLGVGGLACGGATGRARRITFADNLSIDNAQYGFKLTTGDIDGVDIHGNQLFGNTSGPYLNDGTATNVSIRNNPGLNPRGNVAFALAATGVLASNPTSYDLTLYLAGGTLTAIALGGVPLPVNGVHTTATTGGTLAAGTYWYRVSALNAAGETLASVETSIVVPGGTSTNTVTVKWGFVTGATGYNVYGRTTGAELKIATNVQDNTFLDTGAVTPSGALPGADTTGNTATGITAAAAAGAVHTLVLAALSAYKVTYTVAPTVVAIAN